MRDDRARTTTVLRSVAATAWLVLVWVMLWGTWSLGTVLAGIVVAVAIGVLLPLPRVSLDRRLRPCPLLWLVAVFLTDLVVASVQVAWLAVRVGPKVRSAVLGVRLRSESDLVMTVVTELLTLVPGSVVIEISQAEHTLYAHVIDIRDDADIEQFHQRVLTLEERVVRALGTDDDLARIPEVPS